MQMGEALIRGFLASGVSVASKVSASVRNAERQRVLNGLGIRTFGNANDGGAAEIAASSDIIIVGVSLTGLHYNLIEAIAYCAKKQKGVIIEVCVGHFLDTIEWSFAVLWLALPMPGLPFCLIAKLFRHAPEGMKCFHTRRLFVCCPSAHFLTGAHPNSFAIQRHDVHACRCSC